jgi:hypothetical protein
VRLCRCWLPAVLLMPVVLVTGVLPASLRRHQMPTAGLGEAALATAAVAGLATETGTASGAAALVTETGTGTGTEMNVNKCSTFALCRAHTSGGLDQLQVAHCNAICRVMLLMCRSQPICRDEVDDGPSRADTSNDWGKNRAPLPPAEPSRGSAFGERRSGGGFADRDGFGSRSASAEHLCRAIMGWAFMKP